MRIKINSQIISATLLITLIIILSLLPYKNNIVVSIILTPFTEENQSDTKAREDFLVFFSRQYLYYY